MSISSPPPAELRRVLKLNDLVFYGIVLVQPIAAVPLFGLADSISHGHVVTVIPIDTRWNDFAPRLGIAYSPGAADGLRHMVFGERGTTSIHAAAGIFYTSFDTIGASYETGDAHFGYYYVSTFLVYLETPYQSRVNGDNPGQPFPFETPTGGNTSFNPFLPIAFSPAYSPSNKQPYSIDYNVSVQRQLTKTTVVTVAYVGTAGRHLFAQVPNNSGSPALCLQIATSITRRDNRLQVVARTEKMKFTRSAGRHSTAPGLIPSTPARG